MFVTQLIDGQRAQGGSFRSGNPAAAGRADSVLNDYIIFLLPWIFDYRSENSTTLDMAVQGTIVALSLIYFFRVSAALNEIAISRELSRSLGLIAVWLAGSMVAGVFHDQEILEIIKAAAPPVMFMLGAMATYKLLVILPDYRRYIRNMFAVMVAFVVVKAAVVFGTMDAAITQYRFYIISAPIDIFSAYFVARFFYRFAPNDAWGAIVHFGIVIVSFTRTLIMVAVTMLILPYFCRASLLLNRKTLNLVLFAALLIGGMGIVGVSSGNLVITEWFTRFFPDATADIGIDPTAATRLAEIDFQINSLMESASNLLFGLGLSAQTDLTGDWALLVAAASGAGVIDVHDRGFGHCQYTSYVFTGGLVFGSLALITTVYSLYAAARVITGNVSVPGADDRNFLAVWGALGVVGASVYCIVAGVFGDRGHSLFFGVSMGMLFWGYNNYLKSRQR